MMTEYVSWISDKDLFWLLKDEEWVQPSTLKLLLENEEGDVDDRGVSNGRGNIPQR